MMRVFLLILNKLRGRKTIVLTFLLVIWFVWTFVLVSRDNFVPGLRLRLLVTRQRNNTERTSVFHKKITATLREYTKVLDHQVNSTRSTENYEVGKLKEETDSVACKLPKVDPFHATVLEFIKDTGPLKCGERTLSSFQDDVLTVSGKGVIAIRYWIILRSPGTDFSSQLEGPKKLLNGQSVNQHSSNKTDYFEASVKIETDFVRVDIQTTRGQQVEFHMQTHPKKEVLERTVTPAGIPLNIIMIMFDSTSAAHFSRKMKKTVQYLNDETTTVFLEGETVVGDGTTAQLAAMLTGIAEEDQPEARRNMPGADFCDKWRFVFKDYQKRGYVTMFSEDSPSSGTFTYRLKGFYNPPTDHFGRAGWLEGYKHTRGFCTGTQSTHNVSIKYLLSLLKRYKNPKFAFLLFSGLTHDDQNALGYADEDLTNLLKQLKDNSAMDNSMIVIFGDHGYRFAGLRKTLQGKLEERLPHMSITLPKWFPQKHPDLFKNLQHNSKLLTTPFDMYVTLKHILNYPKVPDDIKVGQSLFTKIEPKERACSNNGVEDHWCPCLTWQVLSTQEAIVKNVVDFVVSHINEMISKDERTKELCAKLALKKIQSAQRQMPNEKMQTFLHSKRDHRCDSCGVVAGDKSHNTLKEDTLYQVQFVTSPNSALYETSVKLTKGSPSITGDISRIDRYGDQPACVKENFTHLVKYCLCI